MSKTKKAAEAPTAPPPPSAPKSAPDEQKPGADPVVEDCTGVPIRCDRCGWMGDGAELVGVARSCPGCGSTWGVTEVRPRKVWRTVALVLRSRSIYLDGGLVKLLGGEWVTHPQHVERMRSDPAFRLVEVESAAELARLQADHAEMVAEVRAAAAELGLVVYRDGEVDPPKRPR